MKKIGSVDVCNVSSTFPGPCSHQFSLDGIERVVISLYLLMLLRLLLFLIMFLRCASVGHSLSIKDCQQKSLILCRTH